MLRQESQDEVSSSTSEVEFALVLSRMIDSIKNDPEQLRDTVYELARRKLQEQFTYEDVREIGPLVKALEVAIREVEAFSRKDDQRQQALPRRQLPEYLALGSTSMKAAPVAWPMSVVLDAPALKTIRFPKTSGRKWRFATPWRYVTVLAIVLAVGIAIQRRSGTLDSPRTTANDVVARPQQTLKPAPVVAPQPELPPSAPAVLKPSPLLPTSYGIYAVSEDKLYRLEMLPGRAPDIRVAISPAIATPSRTLLPDGRVRFLVFRRDSGSSAADRAEVRVIAKITRAISFDAAGKPLVAPADDGWVIRNISQSYGTAPVTDNPDMYEIQSEKPDAVLTPGRYALVLKGQAYDFTVAGPVTDTRHCLERLAASNGAFYSQCHKP